MKKTIIFYLLIILLASMNAAISYAGSPPKEITDLQITKSGNNVRLNWTAITTSMYGNPSTITSYNVYRGTTPDFIPDTTGGSNIEYQPNGNSYDDVDALLSTESHFYYVTAVAADDTESLLPSNIGYKIRLDLTYDPAGTNKHWISIPYSANYASASDLGGDAPNISQVIRWDPATQTEEIWDQSTGTGIDFAITPGEAYAIVISANTTMNLVGSNNPSTINMIYNTDNFNVNWLSLPHPNAYGVASNMAGDLGTSTKVGKYDTLNDTYQSWFLLDGTWIGEDFPLAPGEGVLGVITDDTTWTPSPGYPIVTASSDKTDCLNSAAFDPAPRVASISSLSSFTSSIPPLLFDVETYHL